MLWRKRPSQEAKKKVKSFSSHTAFSQLVKLAGRVPSASWLGVSVETLWPLETQIAAFLSTTKTGERGICLGRVPWWFFIIYSFRGFLVRPTSGSSLAGTQTCSDLLGEQFLKRKTILCWEGCLLKDYSVPSLICEGIELTVDRSSSCSLGKTQTRENGENLSFTNIRPKYVHHCTL